MSWITGLYPSQLGITRNCPAKLPGDAPSIVREMNNSGWWTEIVGKTHWTRHDITYNLNQNKLMMEKLGFNYCQEVAGPRALRKVHCDLTEEWKKEGYLEKYILDMNNRYGNGRCRNAWQVKPSILPNHLYPDIWITNQAIERIEKLPEEQPWLIWISFVGPHEPFDTPQEWEKYRNRFRGTKHIRKAEWINNLEDECELKRQSKRWEGLLLDEEIASFRRDYANKLEMLDEQLGRLLSALNRRRDRDNTAIALTADHGEMLGDHEMLYKSTFLEGSVRVPFIFRPAPNTERLWLKKVYKEPVSLTKCIIESMNSVKSKEKTQSFQNSVKSKKPIIIEFGDEMALIKEDIKLTVNNDAKPLWATTIGQDNEEAINILHGEQTKDVNRKLKRLIKYAKKAIKKRKSHKWQKLATVAIN